MSSGIYDPIVSRQEAEKLFDLFKDAGVDISLSWQESGHELTKEIRKAKEWLLQYSLLNFLFFNSKFGAIRIAT